MKSFCKVGKLEERYSIDRETWKKWRLGYRNHRGEYIAPLLEKGIEWNYLNSRSVLYDEELIDSFIRNRSDPKEHLKNVEVYLQSLSRPKRVGRLAKSKSPANVVSRGEQ